MQVTLQKIDDDYVIALPASFVKQHGLTEGSRVSLEVQGKHLTITVGKSSPRYRLDELMAQTQAQGLPRVAGWDEMPSIGLERE